MVFVVSPTFLPVLLTSFVIRTEKALCFSVFSPTQLNFPANSSVICFMIQW